MLSDRVRKSYIAGGGGEFPYTFTFTESKPDDKTTVKLSNIVTMDSAIDLYFVATTASNIKTFVIINNVENDLAWFNKVRNIKSGDTVQLKIENKGRDPQTVTIDIRYSTSTGEILYTTTQTVSKGCYLTSAMVVHYGLDDNGVELTALRTLRELYGEKHKELMKRYEKDSVLIIQGIDHSKNPEAYYHFIRQEVNQIVAYAQKEKWTLAEQVYLDLYHDLKDLFLDNRGGFKWN